MVKTKVMAGMRFVVAVANVAEVNANPLKNIVCARVALNYTKIRWPIYDMDIA